MRQVSRLWLLVVLVAQLQVMPPARGIQFAVVIRGDQKRAFADIRFLGMKPVNISNDPSKCRFAKTKHPLMPR